MRVASLLLLLITIATSARCAEDKKIVTFVDIRDALFFDSDFGNRINELYYRHSPIAVGAINIGATPLLVATPADKTMARKLRFHYSLCPQLLQNPGNFGQLGPLFIDDQTALQPTAPTPLRTIEGSFDEVVADLETQAAAFDRGAGIRRLGGWGLNSLLLFFKSLPLLGLFLLLLIAGALGRWWPLILPPAALLALLLSYQAPENSGRKANLSTAVKTKNFQELRDAFLHRQRQLRLNRRDRRQAEKWLRELCNDQSTQVRYYAAAVAGDLQLGGLRGQLRSMAQDDKIINVRYMAIEALAKMGHTTSILKKLAPTAPSLYEKHYLLNALLQRGVSWNSLHE